MTNSPWRFGVKAKSFTRISYCVPIERYRSCLGWTGSVATYGKNSLVFYGLARLHMSWYGRICSWFLALQSCYLLSVVWDNLRVDYVRRRIWFWWFPLYTNKIIHPSRKDRFLQCYLLCVVHVGKEDLVVFSFYNAPAIKAETWRLILQDTDGSPAVGTGPTHRIEVLPNVKTNHGGQR